MRQIKRAIHFDMHTLPGVTNPGEKFNAKEFADLLEQSHVKYINFFARCNRGYSYYNTKIGTPYPGLKTDMLADMLRECHQREIGVTAYVNAVLNAATAEKHPTWKVHGKDGNPQGLSQMCYNTPYGDYLIKEISEILTNYPEIDGIFADCLDLSPVCYCPECTKKMLAQGVDLRDINQVRNFDKATKLNMARRIRKIVPQTKYLYINGLYALIDDMRGLVTHAEIESLPNGGWGYDCFPTQIAYNRRLFEKSVFMTGRFHQTWGDFGGIRPSAALEYDAYTALAYGAEISIGDHLHPTGAPEKGLFDVVKPLYAKIKELEPWTEDTEYVPEIGVFCPAGVNHFYQYQQAYQGAQRILNELKYQYDIVTELSDFSDYKVMILPDETVLNESCAKKIAEYLHAGGKVLSTGISGLTPDQKSFALPEWDFTPELPQNDLPEYFMLKGFLKTGTPDMVLRNYKPGVCLKQTESLADRIPCYPIEKASDFMYYPYAKPDGLSIAACTRNVVHIGIKLFSSYAENAYFVYKQIIKNALEYLYPDKLVTANLPSFARMTLTKKDNITLLHILSYCPEQRGNSAVVEEPIELYDVTFTLKGSARAVYSLPDKNSLTLTKKDKTFSFTVPHINGHAIYAIET